MGYRKPEQQRGRYIESEATVCRSLSNFRRSNWGSWPEIYNFLRTRIAEVLGERESCLAEERNVSPEETPTL